MDCSPPGSSVHGILQARLLEWVAISFARGSSRPRDRTPVSCIAGRHFTVCTTREVLKIGWTNIHQVIKTTVCKRKTVIIIPKEENMIFQGYDRASWWLSWERICLVIQETQVWSPCHEDLLEKEMATYSSTLAWRISRTEEPGRPPSTGLQLSDTT